MGARGLYSRCRDSFAPPAIWLTPEVETATAPTNTATISSRQTCCRSGWDTVHTPRHQHGNRETLKRESVLGNLVPLRNGSVVLLALVGVQVAEEEALLVVLLLFVVVVVGDEHLRVRLLRREGHRGVWCGRQHATVANNQTALHATWKPSAEPSSSSSSTRNCTLRSSGWRREWEA